MLIFSSKNKFARIQRCATKKNPDYMEAEEMEAGELNGTEDKLLTTEQDSHYAQLEQLSTAALLTAMNAEDRTVPDAVAAAIPQITTLVEAILPRMQAGGRLFYIGSGTSGRLGIVDASECPPTFGVPSGMVMGIIAGGDGAIRQAVEFAEDNTAQGFQDLKAHNINANDSLIGLSASGSAPYVLGAVIAARAVAGVLTGCITCNANAPLINAVDYPVVAVVGPEVLTGSTRLKAGTAQKLILNMISTALMVRLGHVQGNRMIDMQLANHKLIARGARYVAEATGLDFENAKALLLQHGSVRAAVAANRDSIK